MTESKGDGGCDVDRMVYFFCGWGGALVLTSGAGRPRSAPVVPIFRSRSRRESAVTTSTDLLARTNVVHDGRGHLLYRISHLQLLIRCLLLLLLLLLLRHKHESRSGDLLYIEDLLYCRLQLTFRFKINSNQNISQRQILYFDFNLRVTISNFSRKNVLQNLLKIKFCQL